MRVFAGALLCLATAQAVHAQSGPMRSMRPPWPDDLTPVPLNPPKELQLMSGPFQPGQLWVISLNYPSEIPCPAGGSGTLWCRRLQLTLSSGSASALNREVWRLRSRISGQGAPSGYAYTPAPPPDGFGEAWVEESVGHPQLMPLPVSSMVYLRSDADGKPLELAHCITAFDTPNAEPTCTVQTTLDGAPAVQVTIVTSALYWPEHGRIRAAVMRLVDGWR